MGFYQIKFKVINIDWLIILLYFVAAAEFCCQLIPERHTTVQTVIELISKNHDLSVNYVW